MTFLAERLQFGGCHRINQVVHGRDQPAVRPLIEDEPLIEWMLNVPLNHDGAPLEITFTYRTEQGQRFRVYHIARILRNKAYIGILEYNFRQDRGEREPVIVPKFYPPIVDAELFNRVQEKVKSTSSFWQNAHAHRTDYLLSGLVKCDACGHRYVGTSAKGGRFHYYTCQSYIKRGKGACDAPLLNKDRLEKGVLDQIQQCILSPGNVRRYIEMVIEQARSEQQPSAEEKAVSFAIEDTDAKLRRWEEALEDAAHRIKELRHERAALLKTRSSLEQKSSSTAKILPIPTPLMNTYIREMQERLGQKDRLQEGVFEGDNQRGESQRQRDYFDLQDPLDR